MPLGGGVTFIEMLSASKKMKQQKIAIETIEMESIELENHPMKWLFEFEEGIPPSEEHKDQIVALSNKAAKYIWDFESEMKIGEFYPEVDKYFKELVQFENIGRTENELKKWLFNLGVPFKNKVFLSIQPESGFILTWKMVIKYCSKLFFAYDLILFDKSLNWGLFYHHDERFHFGKNRVYNSEIEGEKMMRDAKQIDDWKEKSKMKNNKAS